MTLQDIGIVVIAKNEGERLRRCLASVPAGVGHVVYADSASSDDSVAIAESLGVDTIVLDVSQRPPNQPRGRNAGFRRLLEASPGVRYAFFVDGDCEIVPGFLEAALAQLEADEKLGAVCGQRRELRPEASIYNYLIDTEWNTPVGLSAAFGGDALIRVEALRQAGGYVETMISGEDHELSFRMRSEGWDILRIDHDMTRHDVAIHRFRPWWQRHARGGYAFAHGAFLNRRRPGRFNQKRVANMLFWGACLPFLSLALAPLTAGWSLCLWGAGQLWLVTRVFLWRAGLGDPLAGAALYALFIAIGKYAEAWGVFQCALGLMRHSGFEYVEYKDYQRPQSGQAA